MMTPEKLELYRKQALEAIKARANNLAAPGVSCIILTPHDVLELTDAYIEIQRIQVSEAKADEEPPS